MLDGLGEALDAGDRLLSNLALPGGGFEPPLLRPSFRQRLSAALTTLLSRPPAEPASTERVATLSPEAVSAWRAGLSLIQDRLADILAAEGVVPIVTQDEPFDPHQHVAVETVPATSDVLLGTIRRELRRGYRARDNALCYAEVTVARDAQEKADD